MGIHVLTRGVGQDDLGGWTLALTDEEGYFECSPDDHVLDLVSESELPPFFPFSKWTNLVAASQHDQNDTWREWSVVTNIDAIKVIFKFMDVHVSISDKTFYQKA